MMTTSTRVSPSAASKLIVEINIQPALSASLTATLWRQSLSSASIIIQSFLQKVENISFILKTNKTPRNSLIRPVKALVRVVLNTFINRFLHLFDSYCQHHQQQQGQLLDVGVCVMVITNMMMISTTNLIHQTKRIKESDCH